MKMSCTWFTLVAAAVLFARSTSAAQEPPGPGRGPHAGGRAARPTPSVSGVLPDTRERQRELLADVLQRYQAGEIQLDNGHMWLDGHVYPHAFLRPAEVRAIEAFGQLRHRIVHQVDTVRYHPQWREGMQTPGFDDSNWANVPVGQGTGRQFSEEAYRFTLPALPLPAPGRELFFALRPLHPSKEAWPETTIYVDGRPAGALVRWHDYWEIRSLLDPAKPHQITLKAFGIYNDPPRGYRQIAVVERDPVYDRLYWNLRVLCEAASIVPADSPLAVELRALIRGVLEGVDLVQSGTPTGRAQAEAADQKLEEGRKALAARTKDFGSPGSDFVVNLIFHAHHDTAWQWTVAHSRGKAERIALNNLYLMDRYPEYRYLYTAPVHYQMLQRDHPELFARIKQKVAAGQWLANGAMWIEADVRLPAGESLVRQMLYGMDYFEREFGAQKQVLFLPDTFGHSPVMPQIMRGFGVDTLFAMRIRDVNNPHDVFRWQGIDGTQVLVDAITTPAWEYPFMPELHNGRGAGVDVVSYSAPDPGPRRTFGVWETFKQKAATSSQIMAIGWGDGGGGGTEDHVEVARRVSELPWLPRLRITDPVALADTLHRDWSKYPVYADDLYVGFQRTFTRANRIKQENRRAETLLHDTEFLGAWAAQLGAPYDAAAIRGAWETMLVNHMHDIITGQSVPEVNDEAIARYDAFRQAVLPVHDRAVDAITRAIRVDRRGVVVFNTLGFARTGLVEVELESTEALSDSNGHLLPLHRLSDRRVLAQLTNPIPAYGYETLRIEPAAEATPRRQELTLQGKIAENARLRVTLDAQGRIVSLFDKEAGRETVPPGAALNELLAVRGAAGFGPTSAASGPGTAITQLDALTELNQAPVRVGWQIRRTFGESTITQRLWLEAGSPRLLVENDIDWKEATELQADFPLALKTTTALQGIQFGHVRQTTTRNNPADAARNLLAVHEWVDVVEDDYGFAVLNDGRYGHDVKSGGIRVVLFTNQQVANANGDRGAGRFVYALMPHRGRPTDAGVQRAARDLNVPLLVRPVASAQPEGTQPLRAGLFTVDAPGVILDTVKPAEDGNGWILRLYEAAGRTVEARVTVPAHVVRAEETNLRERTSTTVPLQSGAVTLPFSPFQIRTVRLTFR